MNEYQPDAHLRAYAEEELAEEQSILPNAGDDDAGREVRSEQLLDESNPAVSMADLSDDEFRALLQARASDDAGENDEGAALARFEEQKRLDALGEFAAFMREEAEKSRAALHTIAPLTEEVEPEAPRERVYGDMEGLDEAAIHQAAKDRIVAGLPYVEQVARGIDPADAPLRLSEVDEDSVAFETEYSSMTSEEFAVLLARRDQERWNP